MSTLPGEGTIYADAFRAMAIWQGQSGMPEDRFINTFHFRVGDAGQSLQGYADEIGEAIRSFYMGPNGGTANLPLTNWLSASAINFALGLDVRVYDLRDEEPRPVALLDYAATGTTISQGLPNEVAVCLSYFSQRNIPRRRGRVYFGPLNMSALASHESSGDMGPHSDLVYALRAAAGRLRAATPLHPWAVYSRADGLLYDITQGWVDNSFDTQRRRGIHPTSRQLWPVP